MKSKSSKQKRKKKQLLPALDPDVMILDPIAIGFETVCFISITLEGESDVWEIYLN